MDIKTTSSKMEEWLKFLEFSVSFTLTESLKMIHHCIKAHQMHRKPSSYLHHLIIQIYLFGSGDFAWAMVPDKAPHKLFPHQFWCSRFHDVDLIILVVNRQKVDIFMFGPFFFCLSFQEDVLFGRWSKTFIHHTLHQLSAYFIFSGKIFQDPLNSLKA